MYHLNDIRQVYDARTVLKVDDLTIQQGELLSVVGPSGAGKSTLLRLLHFLEPPTSGQIIFGGLELDYPPPVALRRQICMVFQRPEMIRGSVVDNVALGLKFRGARGFEEKLDGAIRQVGLGDLREAPVSSLSGGELQRVALARVMVLAPKVILLDEPTANLDPGNVSLVETIIRDYHRATGATIVFVTHNVFQARRLADRVAFLLNGELVEVSAVGSFFDDPKDPRSRAFVKGEMVY